MPKIIDSNGDSKFYRGPGRTSNRNMDTREDRLQTEYIKLLSRIRDLERKLKTAEETIESLKKKKHLTKKQRIEARKEKPE